MNRYTGLALALLVGGIVLMTYAVITGEASVGLFLIFPFVMGSGIFSGLGILLIIAAVFVYFYSILQEHGVEFTTLGYSGSMDDAPPGRKKSTGGRRRTRGGGILFIGPVPIVFGSDKKVSEYMLILAILLVVALCIVFFVLLY